MCRFRRLGAQTGESGWEVLLKIIMGWRLTGRTESILRNSTEAPPGVDRRCVGRV